MSVQYIRGLGAVKVLKTRRGMWKGTQIISIAPLRVTDCQGAAAHILSGSVGTVTYTYANGDSDVTFASAVSYRVTAAELRAHTRPFAES